MRKLISKNEATTYSNEKWELDNGIFLNIVYELESIEIFVKSKSGDVADQIYECLRKADKFDGVELLASASYSLMLDKHLLNDFFEYVEAIDVKTLKPGKTY